MCSYKTSRVPHPWIFKGGIHECVPAAFLAPSRRSIAIRFPWSRFIESRDHGVRVPHPSEVFVGSTTNCFCRIYHKFGCNTLGFSRVGFTKAYLPLFSLHRGRPSRFDFHFPDLTHWRSGGTCTKAIPRAEKPTSQSVPVNRHPSSASARQS